MNHKTWSFLCFLMIVCKIHVSESPHLCLANLFCTTSNPNFLSCLFSHHSVLRQFQGIVQGVSFKWGGGVNVETSQYPLVEQWGCFRGIPEELVAGHSAQHLSRGGASHLKETLHAVIPQTNPINKNQTRLLSRTISSNVWKMRKFWLVKNIQRPGINTSAQRDEDQTCKWNKQPS